MRLLETLPELVERQLGLILRGQALAVGLTDGAIQWRIGRGRWQRITSGLYATFSGSLTDEQRLVAAALYGGPGAQITGAAALRWHRVRYAPADPRIHVLVPPPARRTSHAFVVVVRTGRPDPHSRLRPAMEVCSIARAAADTARAGYCLRDVRAFLAEVIQRRLTTMPMLEDELERGPRAGSKLLRDVLSELKAGIRSAPEAELRIVVKSSAILRGVCWNPTLVAVDGTRLPSPDGWIQEVGLALELNSWEFHATSEGWHRTLDRQNRLAAYGVQTLHFTPHEVRSRPARVLALIEQAYRERSTGFRNVTIAESSGSYEP